MSRTWCSVGAVVITSESLKHISHQRSSVVSLANGEDPTAEGVAVHHERYETPAYAFALASLQRPAYPIPIGVFRAVERPTYEALLEQQVESAVGKHGRGDLDALLRSGDTWTVEP